MRKTTEALEHDANAFGLVKQIDREQNRIQWKLCCGCGAEESKTFAVNSPLLFMTKKFRQAGWAIDDKAPPVCPACDEVASKRKPKMPGVRISTDPKIARRVYAKLDDVFADDAKLYRDGYNDARVANERDVALEVVVAIRKYAYGELAEDPVVTELNQRLDELIAEHQATLDEIAETATGQFQSINDRFKNEMLQAANKVKSDLDAAREIFDAATSAIKVRLQPMLKRAFYAIDCGLRRLFLDPRRSSSTIGA